MDAIISKPAELQRVFDLIPLGLLVTSNRVIKLCNRTFCDMFQYKPEELYDKSLEMLYPSRDEFDSIGGRISPVMRAKGGHYSDHRIMKRRSGDLFWCHVTGRGLDSSDPFAYAVWAVEDISATRPVGVKLTARERGIASLLITGKTSKQIAAVLGISPRTVELYRARLLKKFKAQTPGELIARLSGLPL